MESTVDEANPLDDVVLEVHGDTDETSPMRKLGEVNNKEVVKDVAEGPTPCYVITHDVCLQHDIPGHPECPERLSSILSRLSSERPDLVVNQASRKASREQLLLFHTEGHIKKLERVFEKVESALESGSGKTVR